MSAPLVPDRRRLYRINSHLIFPAVSFSLCSLPLPLSLPPPPPLPPLLPHLLSNSKPDAKKLNIPPVLGGLKAGFKKLCVITGASSGLGREAARVLSENDDYFVICAVRDPEKMRTVANELGMNPKKYAILELELSSLASVRRFVFDLKGACCWVSCIRRSIKHSLMSSCLSLFPPFLSPLSPSSSSLSRSPSLISLQVESAPRSTSLQRRGVSPQRPKGAVQRRRL